jgi:sterol desaturase/sphingolipid hydroxylase (fatty acid hydroxylase superfamily)
MLTVTRMSNEIDDRLLVLFAEAHETLPSAAFMQSFLAKMQQARRRQSLRRIALVVALGVPTAWIMPSVLATTAAIVNAVGEQSRPYGELIISPAGWAVSMLIGLLVLLRTGALRRRT